MIKALQEASEDVVGTLNDFQPYQYVGQLGYYTHWMEPDFGLLQLGVRFYDPEVGRFTQRDPMPVTLNTYVYVDAKPGQRVDPSGLFGCWSGMGCEMEMVQRGREAFAKAKCCLCRWRKWWTDRHPWDKKHHPKYGPHMDKVAHCFVSCKCVKEGNPAGIVQAYADLKELYDAVLHCLRLKGDDTGDETANAAGMSIAATKGSNCLPDCLKWVQSIYGDVPKKYLGPWDPGWEVDN